MTTSFKIRSTISSKKAKLSALATDLLNRFFPQLDSTVVGKSPFGYLNRELETVFQTLMRSIIEFTNSAAGVRLVRGLRDEVVGPAAVDLFLSMTGTSSDYLPELMPPEERQDSAPTSVLSLVEENTSFRHRKRRKSAEGSAGSKIYDLARKMGVPTPAQGPWLQMLCEVLEQLPHAIIVTDMRIPGLPITYCNAAMVKMTGYDRQEICGRNCRFLQGPKTDAATVREMVVAIRTAKTTTVRATNYKRDGTTFTNSVTISPVHDSEGVYRYSIGVLVDVAHGISDGTSLEKLRTALPSTMQADAQPPAFDVSLRAVSTSAQRAQYRKALVAFTRLEWSTDWETALSQAMSSEAGLNAFSEWLQSEAPEDLLSFELIMNAALLDGVPLSEAGPHAVAMCRKHLSIRMTDEAAALAKVQQKRKGVFPQMATGSFARFLRSDASLSFMEEVTPDLHASMPPLGPSIWASYDVPEDCAGWLSALVAVAEAFPLCVVISDMSIPGNPMIYVNGEFCRTTGYAKHEAQGQNCRFLQGPKTEALSVAVIQDTLRRGADCHVKITNYRKNGEQFENLLTMRPVHDSNGVYRYCIGLQFELEAHDSVSHPRRLLALLIDAILMIPREIDVQSKPSGPQHARTVTKAEATAELEQKLVRALRGTPIGPKLTPTSASFGGDRQQLLSDIWRHRFANHFPWVGPLLSATVDDSVAVSISAGELPGFPLVMVNRAFEAMTGFSAAEALGRNCRFLQCAETEPHVVRYMAESLRAQRPCEVRITNRRKDGSLFVNLLAMHPLVDHETGVTRLVVATQRVETSAHLAAAKARDDAAAIFRALPRALLFSTPPPPPPRIAPAGELVPSTARSSDGRAACWSGFPVRHHVAALTALLQLKGEALPSGSSFFTDFARSHWRRAGRDARDVDDVMDVRLSLHSKLTLPDPLQLVQQLVQFTEDFEELSRRHAMGAHCVDQIDELWAIARAMGGVQDLESRRRKRRQRLPSAESHLVEDPDTMSDGGFSSNEPSFKASGRACREGPSASQSEASDSPFARRGSVLGPAVASTTPSHASLMSTEDDIRMTRMAEYVRTVHHLLTFDLWHDLLRSPAGTGLCDTLGASSVRSEQRLGEQIASCAAALPTDTDEWMRLFISAVQDIKAVGICICDLSLPRAPIAYANLGFESMTGYALEELVGKPCSLLQGTETDSESVGALRQAIAMGMPCHVRLTNYRKDGTRFNNMLTLRPIFDREGHLVFAVSFNLEVLDAFEKLKPLLMLVDCLSKLLPDKIALPTPPSVHERVSLVTDSLLAARTQFRDQQARALEKAAKKAEETRNLQTATEKARDLANARIHEFRVRQQQQQQQVLEEKAEQAAQIKQKKAQKPLSVAQLQREKRPEQQRQRRQQDSPSPTPTAADGRQTPTEHADGAESTRRQPPALTRQLTKPTQLTPSAPTTHARPLSARTPPPTAHASSERDRPRTARAGRAPNSAPGGTTMPRLVPQSARAADDHETARPSPTNGQTPPTAAWSASKPTTPRKGPYGQPAGRRGR